MSREAGEILVEPGGACLLTVIVGESLLHTESSRLLLALDQDPIRKEDSLPMPCKKIILEMKPADVGVYFFPLEVRSLLAAGKHLRLNIHTCVSYKAYS